MRDHKVYHEGYSYGGTARRQLTIKTNTPLGGRPTQLISPPESANSGRHNSCWSQDVYSDTSPSYHPNTPAQHLISHDQITLDPNNSLRIYGHMNFEDVKYPMPTPSPGGFTYTNEPCSPPEYRSPFSSHLVDQKPPHEPSLSFYTDSSSLLSTSQDSQDWDTSHLGQRSMCEDPSGDLSSLYMVPSESQSYTSTDAIAFESQPSCIDPTQAVHDPTQDYTMSFNESQWGTFHNPVHDSNILPSSSSSLALPPTPKTFDDDSVYCKSEYSPKSEYSRTISRSATKVRREKKQSRRQRQTIQTTTVDNIEVASDERTRAYAHASAKAKAVDAAKKIPIAKGKTFKCHMNCGKQFERAEHCKRHENTHSGEHPYQCLVKDCHVGAKGNGSQNRKDNSRYHAWTHVKAHLSKQDPLVQQQRAVHPGNRHRNNPRNICVSPQRMRALAQSRGTEFVNTLMDFVNKEAGKEFAVHIDWNSNGCPTQRCVGLERGCDKCRPLNKKKSKIGF